MGMGRNRLQRIGFGLQLGLATIAILGGEWALFEALGRLTGPVVTALTALNVVIAGGITLMAGLIGVLQIRIRQITPRDDHSVTH